MIATTIEQSKELHRLGLPAERADMFWAHFNGEDRLYVRDMKYQLVHKYQVCVAWSLDALLELVPKNLLPTLEWRDGENEWEVNVWVDHNIHSVSHYDKECAAYEMVCWLLENNLIEKGGDK